MLSLKDKIVVVTGSQGLIGNSIVKVLRDNGALVLSIDINFKSKNKDQYVIDITDEESLSAKAKDADLYWAKHKQRLHERR